MNDQTISTTSQSLPRASADGQRAARTTLLLKGRLLSTLLRLSAPNVLNLLRLRG
jgi:hypothetical protein